MAFAITNTFTSGATITHSGLNTNFSDISTILNGGLTTSNLSASAGITNAQLANDDYEFVVNLPLVEASAGEAAVATPAALVAIPGTSADGTYTVVSAALACSDVGSQDAQYKLQWGSFDGASNAWSSVQDVVSTFTLTSTAGNDTPTWLTLTVASATLTLHATTQRFLGLVLVTAGTNDMDAAMQNSLCVSLKIRRTNGLRAI